LIEERQFGGHAIERHVGKSPQSLLTDVRQIILDAERKGDLAGGVRVGSFPSLEAANKLVNATIARNQAKVDLIVSGVSPREELNAEFNSITGYEGYARTERSQAYIRDKKQLQALFDFRRELRNRRSRSDEA
jgi:hypothetical protein